MDRLDFINDEQAYKEYLDMQHSRTFQKLQKFYRTKTTLDILGVARQENPHSSFLRWLMDPSESHRLGDYGLKKFCETICFAYKKYAKHYLVEKDNPSLKNKIKVNGGKLEKPFDGTEKSLIRKKLLFFECETEALSKKGKKEQLITALMSGNYSTSHCNIDREVITNINDRSKSGRRADIWIDCGIKHDNTLTRLLILIENKVTSLENDHQTHHYMKDVIQRMGNNGDLAQVDFFVPIFLYVSTNKEMKEAVGDAKKFPCLSRLFMVINYQYLLDGMIAPCATRTDDDATRSRLNDYIACLSQSIFVQNDNQEHIREKDTKSNRNLVMAVSPAEKDLAWKLWNKYNKILTDVGVNINDPKHFLIRNEAGRQFYRAVLTPIVNRLLSDEDVSEYDENKELIESFNSDKERVVYKIRTKDDAEVTLGSYQGVGRNTSALAYIILKQFLINNIRREKPYSIKQIKERLSKRINTSWLCGIFVTQREYDRLLAQWESVHSLAVNTCVCDRYQNSAKAPMGCCPLDDGKYSYFNKRYEGDRDVSAVIKKKSCPLFPNVQDGELRKLYYKGKLPKEYAECTIKDIDIDLRVRGTGCCCIYDFLHNFFVKDLSESGLFSLSEEKTVLERIGCNTYFGKVQYGDGEDDYVYIARWWFMTEVKKMLDILSELNKEDNIKDYISDATSSPSKKMDFSLADL